MALTTDGPSPNQPELGVDTEPALGKLAVRWLFGLAALLGVAFTLGRWLRPELEALGLSFVDRFGLLGMALGTILADGFHCPIPPQFYMLLAVASGRPLLAPLATITVASLIGGALGYTLTGYLGRVQWIARLFSRSSRVALSLYMRHGNRFVIIASLTPIAFSVMCYVAGLCRIPKRAFAIMALIRIPKLFAYYLLVRLGWG